MLHGVVAVVVERDADDLRRGGRARGREPPYVFGGGADSSVPPLDDA